MRKVRATVCIKGRVQGVGFRAATCRTALEYQLTGWVRNLPNGDVMAVFEGKESAVRDVLEWCRQGPALARVDEILIDWEEANSEFETFAARH
ncbi:MAG TPA: acylphosphatase [Desulfuromonadales bacterium]|nr:acylphosphatase [Desulfuromonadales bacterium]